MVISGVNTVTYNGDGITTAWPFTFPVTDDSEIRVQLNNADGTAVIVDSDYYVDLVNSTVYYPGYAPGAEPPESEQPPKVQTGQTITVYREIPMTQESDLGSKWPFEVIEKGLDKLTMIAQQIDSGTTRTIDNALASMFQLAGIVTDSGKLQHITDQLNAIDENAADAADSAASAAVSEANASSYKNAAALSANNAANSATSATNTAAALTAYLDTKETLTAPAVDATLTISGAAADAEVVGDKFDVVERGGTLKPYTLNEFGNEWTAGGYIDNNGNIVSAPTYQYSDFYPVRDGVGRNAYAKIDGSFTGLNMVQYKADKTTVISIKSVANNNVYPLSDDVAYVRFYCATSSNGTLYWSTIQPSDPVDYSYSTFYELKDVALPYNVRNYFPISANNFDGVWQAGGYINVSTNAVVSAVSWKYTPKYTVLYEGQYRTLYVARSTANKPITIIFYDKNFNILFYTSITTNNFTKNVQIPNDAHYVRCYVETAFVGDLYLSTEVPSDPVDYTYSTAIKITKDAIEPTQQNKQLTVVNFGDSIIGNFRDTFGDDISVSALLANMTGYNTVNAGFGGCQMHQHNVAGWTPFSMFALADAIVDNDWTTQDASWADRTALNLPYYFGTTIATLKATDFSKVDVITIEYGTNDWASGDSLVSPTQDPFDTNTFGGALRYTIRKFLTAYPKMAIIVQNPTPRFVMSGSTITETSDTNVNASGDTLVDLIDEENKVCKEYKIPVIDAYYNSGFNIYTHDTYYGVGDGVHLALDGRKKLASIIANYMLSHCRFEV